MNTISSIGKMAHIFLSGALLLLRLFNGFTQPAVAAAPVTGNTFVVNSALDTPNVDPATGVCADAQGRCTLRAAIMVADFVSGASTIVLPAGTYQLTRPGYDNSSLVGDLDISHDLTIQGAGGAPITTDQRGYPRPIGPLCDIGAFEYNPYTSTNFLPMLQR